MRYRTTSQSQRARRVLNHEALKRSHRRSDLIRLATEEPPVATSPAVIDATTQDDSSSVATPHS
ncbi:MAG: hypothetical protein ABTR54_18145 [Candidatus Competibacter sp.]|jgi:hypothetical protein